MVTAIYPGMFDPITNGHVDIATRASRLFDRVIIAVADSAGKNALFEIGERVELTNIAIKGLKNIDVVSFNVLVTDLAREYDATVIIRGIRAVSDFDYEFQMAGMNRQLYKDIETVFLTPAENLSYISSSLVREIAAYNGDVSLFVNAAVAAALKKRFANDHYVQA